ncbi:TPA: hypothetical protein KRD93_003106 [Clostridioides difficile]|nr:hypothetical protein [Clostridioides difficile]
MKILKKITSIIFLIIMITVVITGCSQQEQGKNNSEKKLNYNVLGEKTRHGGTYGDFKFVVIEMPKDFDPSNCKNLSKDFLNYYNENVDTITVYVYEKCYKLESEQDMYKNSLYDITIEHRDEDTCVYSVWDVKSEKITDEGSLD